MKERSAIQTQVQDLADTCLNHYTTEATLLNRHRQSIYLDKRYNWEEANILIIKITANVIVTSLLQTFRPSSGAIKKHSKKTYANF